MISLITYYPLGVLRACVTCFRNDSVPHAPPTQGARCRSSRAYTSVLIRQGQFYVTARQVGCSLKQDPDPARRPYLLASDRLGCYWHKLHKYKQEQCECSEGSILRSKWPKNHLTSKPAFHFRVSYSVVDLGRGDVAPFQEKELRV